jgi:glycosyltransferase involved in cell wall biosynthesis
LSLGRLDPRKRLDLLLDAFALIVEEIPEARLRIVGRPGYAPNQLSLVKNFRHRAKVEYQGAVPRHEVPALLRETSVLMQVSENEDFGTAVAEALACGVPVVLGTSNGTAEYVDDYSRVFTAHTAEQVAHATREVLGTVVDRPDCVRKSTRANAERWFSPGPVAEQLLEIVESAIKSHSRNAGPKTRWVSSLAQ